MLRHSLGIILASAFLLTGCQSSMIKQFNQVKSGMDKDDVLEIMGSPNRSERFHGKDRWSYNFYDQKIQHNKEVHFFEGNAVYVGDTWEPPQEESAVAVDKKNELSGKQVEEQLAKENEVLRAAQREYSQYETQQKRNESIRYVPTFQGVE